MAYQMSNETKNEFFDYITGLVNDDVLVKTTRSSYVTYYDLNGKKITGYSTFSKIISDTKVRHYPLWIELQQYKKHVKKDIKIFISSLLDWIVINKRNRRQVIKWIDRHIKQEQGINDPYESDSDDDEDE
jgi:hypothetical protein